MTKPKSLDGLKHKRRLQKSKLVNFQKEIETFSQSQLTSVHSFEIETHIANAKQVFDEFDKVQMEIELKVDHDSLDAELKERAVVEKNYFAAVSKAKFMMSKISPESPQGGEQNIKLPTIKLPIFDGSYENWLEFKDTFISLIHQNQSISEIQKFHYLRAALRDNAATIISSIEFSATNYHIAWQSLYERYNNEDLLIGNHVSALLDLPRVSKGSAEEIRELIDSVTKHLRSLQVLNEPVSHWDTLMIQIVSRKLDTSTIREWEEFKADCRKPSFEDFRKFLTKRATMLESIQKNDAARAEKTKSKASSSRVPTRGVFVVDRRENVCTICKQNHLLFNCKEFINLTPQQRLEKAFRLRLCLNCLKPNHHTKNCSSGHCRKCQGKHNSLLHGAEFGKISSNHTKENEIESLSQQSSQVIAHHSCLSNKQVVLPTALVSVIAEDGKRHNVRALLDSGAQSSFITANLARILNSRVKNTSTKVTGVSNIATSITGTTSILLSNADSTFKCRVSCLVLPKITGVLPNSQIELKDVKIPNVPLADPSFHKPGPIDVLIGSDLFWKIIKPGDERFRKQYPFMAETVFGWIIAGSIGNHHSSQIKCAVAQCKIPDIQEQLQRFWEVEEVTKVKAMSPDEIACENHFQNNTVRESDGRFKVKIPFKCSTQLLGNSEEKAKRQFFSLEQRLHKNPNLHKCYVEFLREYEELGHMKQAKRKPGESAYYMPHHGVLREDKITTRLRVVFNASMPSDSNYSLNDLQYSGPTIQEDLYSIALRFRKYQIAISADIKKMYRQVKVDEGDTRFQGIFWRESPKEELKTYELTTVTYGTTAGSFLATRCLKQIADEHKESQPEISAIIESDFYVDDLLTGADAIQEAVRICQETSKVLSKGCFELHKWKSNQSEVLKSLVADSTQQLTYLGGDEKVLGLTWSSQSDCFMFNIKWNTFKGQSITKRSVLSNVSTIFDPLGLISPCILYAKILLQKLWLLKLSWDDVLPEEARKIWSKYLIYLRSLNELKIPRKVVCDKATNIQLHCFSDASQLAYGSCIYVRSKDAQGKVTVRLLCSKGRVAPLKTLTIPKLELCGAHLASKLLEISVRALKMQISSCTMWTDSTIVLGWLKTPPCQLKTFVSNRVAEIQEITQDFTWKHIESHLNPADILSRGVLPETLRENESWWEGPEFLKLPESKWPKSKFHWSQDLPERRNEVSLLAITQQYSFDFERFSSLIRLKRTLAYMLRFRNNCLSPNKIKGELSVDEINNAFYCLVKIVQRSAFSTEIKNLEKGKALKKHSKILCFTPFMDSEGLLRVGGRLKNSNYDFEKRHPILLPSRHHLSKLIVSYYHQSLYHASPLSLLSSIKEQFWILSGRSLCKKIVRTCVKCVRFSSKPLNPLMGDLPSARVTTGFPFQATGVDYAGPFTVKNNKGRGAKTSKAWICLFVCMKTHAVHIELVTSLSTEEFLASFRRFISRRGRPNDVYSDNGTNFVGANNELKKLFKDKQFQAKILQKTATQGINWHFMPPRAPHMGGLWESGVKSCKHHLNRVLRNCALTFEELYTVLTEIEAILNSRPLTPLSSDPNDFHPLTPAHFLIGRSLNSLPDPDMTSIKVCRLSRYQFLQTLSQHFWRRWQKEYVAELQKRVKWQTEQTKLQIGDMVVIKEDNLPPKLWSLGRVIQLHPGVDGITRVADINTQNGVIRRPLTKISLLFSN